MCEIVENIDDVILSLNEVDNIICIPIYSDRHLHPLNQNNKLSLIYINDMNSKLYILPFNHYECNNISMSEIYKLYNLNCNIFTNSKNSLIKFIKPHKIFDVSLINYYINGTPLNIDDIRINAIDFMNNKLYNMKNVNTLIPLYKHVEWCNVVSSKFIDIIHQFKSKSIDDVNSYKEYNKEVPLSLYNIEKHGIKVDTDNFINTFGNRVKKHIVDEKVYSNYNIFTSTGRPSNSFGNINFAALKKDGIERKYFIPENNLFIEYDYDAYHLRLIGELIGYNFGKDHVHEHFSKIYDVSYEESKQITFKLLYGGIDKEISDNVEFFNKIDIFINNLWKNFINQKEIKTYIYNRPMYKWNFNNIDKNKLFNFYIQSMETEYNIKKIIKIQELLNNYNSKLVLYSYDSFLFDIDTKDGKQLLHDIRLELESDGFITKIKSGKNYNDMINVSDKI